MQWLQADAIPLAKITAPPRARRDTTREMTQQTSLAGFSGARLPPRQHYRLRPANSSTSPAENSRACPDSVREAGGRRRTPAISVVWSASRARYKKIGWLPPPAGRSPPPGRLLRRVHVRVCRVCVCGGAGERGLALIARPPAGAAPRTAGTAPAASRSSSAGRPTSCAAGSPPSCPLQQRKL